MAWAKGTADDFIDFLRKFRDYAAGTIDPATDPDITDGVIVPSPDRWEILTNGGSMPGIPSSGFATDGEVYLKGPGSDVDDEICVGFKTYRSTGTNVFGWEMRGFTQFNSALTFTTQPGVSPATYAAFDDTNFDVFFWVNARRIMAVARIGTTDILVHLGFIQQFGTRSQYPYPLLIGGSQSQNTTNFQLANFLHSCLPDPCPGGASLRWVDGSWITVQNYYQNSADRSQATTTGGNVVWPLRDPTSFFQMSDSTGGENSMFNGYNSNFAQVTDAEIAINPVFPATIMNATNLIGRVDGLFVCPVLGLTAGDTLTDSSVSPADVYDVFKNTWRSEEPDYFAVKRE